MKILLFALLIVSLIAQQPSQEPQISSSKIDKVLDNQQKTSMNSENIQVQFQHPKQGADIKIQGPKIDDTLIQPKPVPAHPSISPDNPFYRHSKQKNNKSNNKSEDKINQSSQNPQNQKQLRQNRAFGNYFNAKRRHLPLNKQQLLEQQRQKGHFNFILFYAIVLSILFGLAWLLRKFCCKKTTKSMKNSDKNFQKQSQHHQIYNEANIRQDDDFQEKSSKIYFGKERRNNQFQGETYRIGEN